MTSCLHRLVPAAGTLALGTLVGACAQPLSAPLASTAASFPAAAASAPAAVAAARGPALALALEAARTAVETCTQRDQKIGVTVIDSAGITKVVLATDGASPRGVQSSTTKALTALAFKEPTSQVGEQAKGDKALADRIAANPSFNSRAGGLLVRVGDEVIGAIGVGGARGSEIDEACALAGLQKVQARLL